MRKLTRSQMTAWKVRQLKVEQGGLCGICGLPIDLSIKGEGVIDHDHDTGEVRGVLHRSCNAAEGKVANAAGRWGAKTMKYSAIVEYLKKLVSYLERPGCGVIYPMHKTEDDKREARNAAARLKRAQAKAAQALRSKRNV